MTAHGRRAAMALLAAAVLLGHALLGGWLAEQALALGDGRSMRGPPRLVAQFVVDLAPTAPPAVAPAPAAPAPQRRRPALARPAPAASAPAASAVEPVAPMEPGPVEAANEPALARPERVAATDAPPTAPTPDPVTPMADAAPSPVPSAVTSADASPTPVAPAASAATTFEWPRSTRLSYRLTGYYRGPVEGQARVEWLREDDRYQVHLEVSVGPSFAPLMSRRMSSDGLIAASGLQPRRYDEETRVALRDPRRLSVAFDGSTVTLANGTRVPQPAGVQDTASQFVHLTWLFSTQPEQLRGGQSVPVMLALPRRVDAWVYDVLAPESLYTPAGVIDAVHVRPRRPERPSGELTAEVWIAPTLQYLPVRIVIRQDAETFVDLLLDRLPQQAADSASAPR